LGDLPIYIDDTGSTTVPQIKARLRRLPNLGFVVIDYLGLLSSTTTNKNANVTAVISEMTRQLKLMAKDLNVPVMLLAQLSRGPETRTDHHPILADLRDSGSIEQDADIVLFLYREHYYNNSFEDPTLSECIVAKNRHGETGTIKLHWDARYTRFSTPTNEVPPY
jgi:replicative DNA helicase